MISNKLKNKIDRSTLKFIAVVPMAIGHFLSYCGAPPFLSRFETVVWLLMQLSLFAPPIFFFFIAEGFAHTHKRRRYALRLLLFALVTQIPFCLANNGTLLTTELLLTWNIIFTLFLGLIALCVWESKLKLTLRIAIIVLMDGVTVLITSEWMLIGIAVILGFRIFRDRPKPRLIWFASCMAMLQLIMLYFNSYQPVACIRALIAFAITMSSYFVVTTCYSGERGKHPAFSKWFFYIFYPAHLFLIYIVRLATGTL